jgi:hypothetical protein
MALVRRIGPTVRFDLLALCGVAAVYALAQLLLVGLQFGLGWDETVYASQVRGGPRLGWTAPRARGIPALIAPIVHATPSVPALRAYLLVLSSVALVLAYRPWLRVRPGFAVPVAALCFSSLWISVFYGLEAMPNLTVALSAVAAAGYFVQSLAEPERRTQYVAVTGWLGLLALVRPSDGLYLGLPLLAIAVRSPSGRWRRLAAVSTGLALGWTFWAVEAVSGWGSVLARVHAASRENSGSGLHANLFLYARTLGGPIECCTSNWQPTWSGSLLPMLWWFGGAALVAVGLWHAGTRRRAYMVALSMACLLAAQYLFQLSVVGVRHLLPVYALLALPAAEGVCWLFAIRAPRRLPSVAALGLLTLLGHLIVQQLVLQANVDQGRPGRVAYRQVGQRLARYGVTPPCAVFGTSSPPVAYFAGCTQLLWYPNRAARAWTHLLMGKPAYSLPSLPGALQRHDLHLAVVLRAAPEGNFPFLRTWRRLWIADVPGHSWRVYTPAVPAQPTTPLRH